MSYSGWKQLERRHAKRMKGIRIWRKDFGESKPDGESETDVWDCKYTIHSFAVSALFAKCEKKYREFTGDRRFSLVLYAKKASAAGDLVVLRADDYAALLEELDGRVGQ